MTTSMSMAVPLTSDAKDVEAAERNQALTGAFVLDPVYVGDWPPERKLVHGDKLPAFTAEQKRLLLDNKQDHIYLQHYTSSYTYHNASKPPLFAESTTTSSDGVPLPQADSPWLFVFPAAFRDLLNWLTQLYKQPIIVTENGVSAPGESTTQVGQVLCDRFRLSYYQQYIGNATAAVEQDGVNLQGYFSWSQFDNFEWADGYSKRFGSVYVDFSSPSLARYYKASSLWLSHRFGLSNITAPPGGSGR